MESDEAMALRLSAEEEEAAKYTSPSIVNVAKGKFRDFDIFWL